MHGTDQLTSHFRLSPIQQSALKRLGIVSVRDLLYHFPSRHAPLGETGSARTLVKGQKVTLFGTVSKLKARKLWKSRRNATEGWFEDQSGKVKLMWFNQPYMASYLKEGALVKLSGVVGGSDEKPYIANPTAEPVAPSEVPQGVLSQTNDSQNVAPSGHLAMYPESRGITSLWIRHAIKKLFDEGVLEALDDPLPKEVRERYNLPDIKVAMVWIHAPEKSSHAEAARKRFAFEEVFAMQVVQARERAENDAQASFPIHDAAKLAKKLVDSTGLSPTGAQTRAIADIISDFDKNHPMARLLEGDVGSGKTLVAAATAYAAVRSRPPGRISGTLQVAYMAPTEILAEQHFQSFIGFFKHAPINIALITGSGCKKFPSKISADKATDISRAQLLKWVKNGEIAMVVGTHALIQKSVQFQHLAYAIVDEQHRFGTRQRRALVKNSEATPHFLSMTATPIPRTLALTMYGDLDLSILDELPPGRAKITTKIVRDNERDAVYESIRKEIARGRQVYVICPRIEEPDPKKLGALMAKSVKTEAKRLKKDVFPEYEIGLLHGAMKPKEKDAVMKKFAAQEIDILVATSVIEVGINVPNATVIIIEGAERFGLAQLHQLRGRVMRSEHPPFCYLMPDTAGDISMKRLRALEKSDDGFSLAETDLEARGAGDLLGRRQSGLSDIGMEALKNVKLIRAAREEAQKIVQDDPNLAQHHSLLERTHALSKELHGE